MTAAPEIILASTSPRRRALLERLNLRFRTRAVDVNERPLPGEAPRDMAKRTALLKASHAAELKETGIILGADTIVVFRGEILGKPKDEEEAVRTLQRLRGKSHEVITGLALLNTIDDVVYAITVTTKVRMRQYTDEEIAAYVASGDPLDKAGSYAIQNETLRPVERIKGCYFNVVGLPLCKVIEGLLKLGYPREALPEGDLRLLCPHDVQVLQITSFAFFIF